MSRVEAGRGQLTTEAPSYDRATKRFAQVMTFRSAGLTLDGPAVGRITDFACRMFRDVILMNELDDFSWPPDEVEVVPSDDFKAAIIMLATRADKKSVIVLQ